MEEPTAVGHFSTICWNDVNNGCAHAKFNASKWLHHIKQDHADKADVLIPLLALTYREYRLFLESE